MFNLRIFQPIPLFFYLALIINGVPLRIALSLFRPLLRQSNRHQVSTNVINHIGNKKKIRNFIAVVEIPEINEFLLEAIQRKSIDS